MGLSPLTPEEVDTLCRASASRFQAMQERIRAAGSALVAFSGGVDSTLVLKVAVDALGDRAVALTAVSAALSPEELAESRALAQSIGARHVEVVSKELDDPRYAANPSNRCYFCKSELYSITTQRCAELGLAVVMDGFNADDTKDHRPGHQAAKEHRVYSPLAEAGLSKAEVRAWSAQLGLKTWDKPQMACLASRLPYGTAVTLERLRQIAAAERALRELGFVAFRVRHHLEVARLEISAEELPRLLGDDALRERVNRALKLAGFTFVAIDLEPFRSGRLNDSLSRARALPVLGAESC